VAGGAGNRVSGSYGVVPGGDSNTAAHNAFAAGTRAKANHKGSFVWGDSTDADFLSTTNDQVSFRCQGGVRFTGTGGFPPQEVYWTPGDPSWNFYSDRALKEGFKSVDTEAVLDKVVGLPVSEWNYKGYRQRHIGVMAQDFNAAFPLNDSTTTLNEADLHGVALAAIQGLNQKVEAQRAENAELKARLEKLERLLNEKNGGGQ
jgi:hypothetical protein